MKPTIRLIGVSLVFALILLGVTSHEAKADFMIYPNPSQNESKLFNSADHKDVSTFDATLSGHIVTVDTLGNVNSGAGFATIVPVKGGILTEVTFIPAETTLFGDFSFRGQLSPDGFDGVITLVVTDSNNQTFTFTIDKPNKDFERIGIIAVGGSGETISQVSISSAGFKEVKQIEFSGAEGQQIPEPGILLLLGMGMTAVGFASRWIRKI